MNTITDTCRCDVIDTDVVVTRGPEHTIVELSFICSSGIGAAHLVDDDSITVRVKDNVSLWGLTVPIDESWNLRIQPTYNLPPYVCASDTHKVTPGKEGVKSVSFYGFLSVETRFTKYACGRVKAKVTNKWPTSGNKVTKLTKCE